MPRGKKFSAEQIIGKLREAEADFARREGRDYEPASMLLERIAVERSAATNGEQRRRSKLSPANGVAIRRSPRAKR